MPDDTTATGMTVLDLALGVAALVAVALAVTNRLRRDQAMAFLTLGVVMSIIWLRLGSVDVALAEAALGTGLLSALLVWSALSSPDPSLHAEDSTALDDRSSGSTRARPRWPRAVLGVVAGTVITVVTAAVWLRVEQQLPTWQPDLGEELPATGVEHEVTGVLLAFRAYDTLLESAVLMFAGVTVLVLGRGRGLAQTRTALPPMPPLLRWLARLVAPVLVLVGLWLLLVGSSGPGGAFQSGAVFAGLLILLRTARIDLTGFDRRVLRPLLVGGVIVFVLAGTHGPLAGEPWLSWDPAWAFAVILAVEVFLTAGIAAGLYLLFLGLESPFDSATEESSPSDEQSPADEDRR